jgi:hypothetical protein
MAGLLLSALRFVACLLWELPRLRQQLSDIDMVVNGTREIVSGRALGTDAFA